MRIPTSMLRCSLSLASLSYGVSIFCGYASNPLSLEDADEPPVSSYCCHPPSKRVGQRTALACLFRAMVNLEGVYEVKIDGFVWYGELSYSPSVSSTRSSPCESSSFTLVKHALPSTGLHRCWNFLYAEVASAERETSGCRRIVELDMKFDVTNSDIAVLCSGLDPLTTGSEASVDDPSMHHFHSSGTGKSSSCPGLRRGKKADAFNTRIQGSTNMPRSHCTGRVSPTL